MDVVDEVMAALVKAIDRLSDAEERQEAGLPVTCSFPVSPACPLETLDLDT